MVQNPTIIIFAILLTILSNTGMAKATDVFPKELTITHSASYPPFAFINEQGVPSGYLIDLWKAFGEANNTSITFKLVPWKKSLELVKDGKADLHAGLFYTKERDEYLTYGPTITQIFTDLYAHKSLPDEEIGNKPIGVIHGGYSEHFMNKEQPDRELIPYATSRATVEAAQKGKILEFISDQPTAVYHMRMLNILDQFRVVKELYSNDLKVAVREGNQKMLQHIQAGWLNVDPALRRHIQNKWFVEEEPTPSWVLPGFAITTLALVLGLLIRAIGRRTHKM